MPGMTVTAPITLQTDPFNKPPKSFDTTKGSYSYDYNIGSPNADGSYDNKGHYQSATPGDALNQEKFDASQAALKALQAQLGVFEGTGYAPAGTPLPPTIGGTGYDPAADAATYTRAKENTGLAAQSAIKGLRSSLSQRGVTGTGVEAAGTRDIFSGALSNLAETDRTMAENTAGRQFTAGQSAQDRAVTQRGQDISAQQFQQSQWLEKFKALLQAYSS